MSTAGRHHAMQQQLRQLCAMALDYVLAGARDFMRRRKNPSVATSGIAKRSLGRPIFGNIAANRISCSSKISKFRSVGCTRGN
jgi:hypothetical protein